ncbi:unnamed protein product [Cylindrotheca closterium]|uniref:RZ-type domain-containing protein n=1 Tax=Cylindrotheca closterium TaxID=2856 RepID=A0AAD2JLM3_9STRA|nr:unnamed protein product [Cylindrotheca closterium]
MYGHNRRSQGEGNFGKNHRKHGSNRHHQRKQSGSKQRFGGDSGSNRRRYGGGAQGIFDRLLNEDQQMTGTDAIRFLEGMAAFNSKPLLLELMLHQQKHGIKRIGEILSFVGSEGDLTKLFIPLLKHGINEETSKPLYQKMQSPYLHAVYLVPGIMDFLAECEDFVTFCSKETADLLCTFLLILSKKYGEVRNSEAVATVATNLQKRGDVTNCETLHALLLLKEKELREETLERLNSINNNDLKGAAACWASDMVPPGGRHTNDHLNFRDILIVPPADELNCLAVPYLPLQSKENRIIEDEVSYLLDRNFRLLREDVLKSMISSLEERRRPWHNARIIGMDFSRGQSAMSFLVQVDPPQQRKIDWAKTRALGSQTIVAFLDEDGEVVRTGTISISNCDDKKGARHDWLNHPTGPIIGVTIEDSDAFDEALGEAAVNRLMLKAYNNAFQEKRFPAARGIVSQMKTYEMIEVSKSFFAYSSILKGLQNLDGLPFHDEILKAETPKDGIAVPDYFPNELTIPKLGDKPAFRIHVGEEDLTPEFLEQNSTLDTSQAKAVRHALTNRVALIQGPPGTGKTFIGGLIAQIILQNTNEKILCLCYTNHALDQFLEHLLEAGNKSIVRLGGRTKSEALEGYQLFHLSKAKRDERGSNRGIRIADAQFYKEREEIEELLKIFQAPVRWNFPNGGIASILRKEYPNEYQYVQVPSTEGFETVGKNNQKMKKNYLWEEWEQGKKPPAFASEAPIGSLEGFHEFWNQPKSERAAFVLELKERVLESSRMELQSRLTQVKELVEQRDAARRIADLQILKDASIIGATTSGAAKYQDILKSIAPGVIMVEEAGEVLESHVLTALSSRGIAGTLSEDTKHLILIGDHKQLRPKVDTYELTNVSRKGFDLDVSLFERLILGGLESSCLSTQHRMRTDISSFIRAQTYPRLIDHQSVMTFPDIRGLSQNIVFIDHDNLEDARERDELDVNQTSTSKSNQFEAELAVETVRYLLLQGYAPSNLVVLTPYLGQLKKIVRLMEKELRDVSAFISEKDLEDFDKDGEEDELNDFNKAESRTVRCSSVDNYQGEESDIVIASLVRCNDRGTIGFLKEPQRVNVLLSRARHGMIIIGSSKTLLQTTAGEQTWGILLNMMEERGQIKSGLPTVCRLHPEDPPLELFEWSKFRYHRPNGGCHRSCNFRLACGHVCPLKCHPIDQDHSVAEKMCVEACRRIPPECAHGHPCTKRCNQECGHCKTLMGPVTLSCGHVKQRITCHENRSPEALELVSKRCVERVETTFSCGHKTSTTCSNAKSENPVCPEPCGQVVEGCLHPCANRCSKCDGKHICRKKCGRTLFCGHDCELACHHGTECPPCTKKCVAVCAHSMCCKSCGDSCAACVEECVWECEHRERCDLVCGAPCTRLPCNERCKEKLRCGHQCPSVCGEVCPGEEYCVECASDDVKTTVVDMIMMEKYAEHDIDADPIIVLPCGHFYGLETLDGHFELDKAYEKSSETGEYVAIEPLFYSEINDRPMKCPDCRAPISLVRRYGRILNYKSLQTLERKHMTGIRKTFNDLSQAKKKDLQKMLNLRKEIEASPMKLVQDACQSLNSAEQVEAPGTSSSLLLQWVKVTAPAYGEKAKSIESKQYKKAAELFLEGIALAASTESWLSCASLRIDYVKFLLRFQSFSGSKTILWEHLDWVIFEMPVPQEDQIAIAKELKQKIAQSNDKAMREAIAAMDAGQTNWNFGGGGASGHWYECPNGHPYFIGDCGGAMVTSTCYECGAQIGGSSHRVLGSNRAWRGLGN